MFHPNPSDDALREITNGTFLEVHRTMVAVALVLSILIGLSLGLLGGGGSILTVPILSYVAGMSTKAAIASSLFVVATTSGVAAISHARAGRVQWRTGLLFGGAGMVGAYGGGFLAAYIPGRVLMVGFGLMMAATAIAMLRKTKSVVRSASRPALPFVKVVIDGVAVGVVTGLVGAGGGFLVVPALVLLGGLSMQTAVGTSLLVIAMKSLAGLAGHLEHVDVDWTLTLAVTGAAVVGSLIGGRLVDRIPPETLRRGFGLFIVIMAVFVVAKELV